MRLGNLFIRYRIDSFLLIFLLGLSACRKEKNSTALNFQSCAAAEPVSCDLTSKGCAQTFTGPSISPDLIQGSYIGVAYTLGNTKVKNDGSEAEQVIVDNSSQLSFDGQNILKFSESDVSSLKTVIANRFQVGASSDDEVWSLIEAHDRLIGFGSLEGHSRLLPFYSQANAVKLGASQRNANGVNEESNSKVELDPDRDLHSDGELNPDREVKSVRSTGPIPPASKSVLTTSMQLTSKNCPSGNVDLGIFGGSITPAVSPGENVCILKKDSLSASVSEAEILSWSEKVMSDYKKFFGEMNAMGNFSMSPWIVLMDTSKITSLSGVLGAFVRDPSALNQRPILIINTSALNNSSNRSDVLGTIAHELYHGVSYYFKVVKAQKSLETTAIDEGIAHVFEDIFGNSALVESNWGQSFIGAALDGLYPLLNSWSGNFDAKGARGGAHSFIYYLADRAGGFKLESSTPQGPGLECVKSMVTSATTGVANLELLTGDNMVNLIGDFVATVIMDQSRLAAASKRWVLNDKFNFPSITGASVSFGHRFSYNYDDLSELSSSDLESPYYSLNGFRWRQESNKKLRLSSSAENLGLTLVRIE